MKNIARIKIRKTPFKGYRFLNAGETIQAGDFFRWSYLPIRLKNYELTKHGLGVWKVFDSKPDATQYIRKIK